MVKYKERERTESSKINRRITESLRLEKTSKILYPNHHPITSCPLPMSLSATSTWFLNTSRDGDSTTLLGSLFKCVTILSKNKFSQISNLNFPWHNWNPLPLILSIVTQENEEEWKVSIL